MKSRSIDAFRNIKTVTLRSQRFDCPEPSTVKHMAPNCYAHLVPLVLLHLYNMATTQVSAEQCRKERLELEMLLEWEGWQKIEQRKPTLGFLANASHSYNLFTSFISHIPSFCSEKD
ncbi:hypothetical protein ABKV19_013384 [Rosa sericea]